MVDIHCHILPNVDDGPTSWETCVSMCEMARADGVEHIVAAPHANSKYRYRREALAELLEELSRRVKGSPKLSLGCDFHLSYENLVDALAHPAQYAIAGTQYLLVELSDFSVPPSVSDNLRRLLAAGMAPIITHPERNPVLQRTPQRVIDWVEEGCLVQVTANSLTGRWGQQALKTAEWLMKREGRRSASQRVGAGESGGDHCGQAATRRLKSSRLEIFLRAKCEWSHDDDSQTSDFRRPRGSVGERISAISFHRSQLWRNCNWGWKESRPPPSQ
jgi:protein-tyrosine phosphatase